MKKLLKEAMLIVLLLMGCSIVFNGLYTLWSLSNNKITEKEMIRSTNEVMNKKLKEIQDRND